MNNSEIIDKLLSGEIKLYQVDREVSAKEATDIRREFLEKKYSIDLDNISEVENQDEMIGKMLIFVTDWLKNHILELDTQIGK